MNIFSQYFGRFLASRQSSGLFRRRAILDSLSRGKRDERLSDALNRRLVNQARSDLDGLVTQLGSSVQGLSDEEAAVVRAQHGLNEVEHERPVPWWRHLWLQQENLNPAVAHRP